MTRGFSFGKIQLRDDDTIFSISYNGTVRFIINKSTGKSTFGAVDGTGAMEILTGAVRAENFCFVGSAGASPDARFYSKNAQSQEFYQTESAGVELVGTKSYLKFPSMTSTQRDALTASAGMVIYNTTTSKLQVYSSAVWTDLH